MVGVAISIVCGARAPGASKWNEARSSPSSRDRLGPLVDDHPATAAVKSGRAAARTT